MNSNPVPVVPRSRYRDSPAEDRIFLASRTEKVILVVPEVTGAHTRFPIRNDLGTLRLVEQQCPAETPASVHVGTEGLEERLAQRGHVPTRIRRPAAERDKFGEIPIFQF